MTNEEKIEYYEKLMWLASRDIILFSSYNQETDKHDGWFHPFLLCSDTFVYASADGEELYPKDVDKARVMFEKFGWDGITALVSALRQCRVLPQLRTEKYNLAMQELGEDPSTYERGYD
jgi:hypothetical protein